MRFIGIYRTVLNSLLHTRFNGVGDGPLHVALLHVGVGVPVLVPPIIAVHLLGGELVEEAVARLVLLDGVEVVGITQQPFDVNLLVRVVDVRRIRDGTAYLSHPVHPPFLMFSADLRQDLSLLVLPPRLHPHLHASLLHRNHQ